MDFVKENFLILVLVVLIMALFSFVALFFVSAPYGKFIRTGWGKTIPARYAWLIMESPSCLLMFWYFIQGESWQYPLLIVFLILWQIHYFHRTFIYPFTISSPKKPFPVLLVLFAIIFNLINGSLNGYEIFIQANYPEYWFYSAPFLIGLTLFILGYYINKNSDSILRKLKDKDSAEYKIPDGGMFRFISCPHYFGEMLEWLGWAILTWSIAGTAFFIFTFANLAPRAWSSHNWYKTEFKNYPTNRRILFPFIW